MENCIPKTKRLKGGIYIIKSTVTVDTYIGQTYHFNCRHFSHHCGFGSSGPPLLRQYVKKYGAKTLYMELLEVCNSAKRRRSREWYYIRKLRPTLNKHFMTDRVK